MDNIINGIPSCSFFWHFFLSLTQLVDCQDRYTVRLQCQLQYFLSKQGPIWYFMYEFLHSLEYSQPKVYGKACYCCNRMKN